MSHEQIVAHLKLNYKYFVWQNACHRRVMIINTNFILLPLQKKTFHA